MHSPEMRHLEALYQYPEVWRCFIIPSFGKGLHTDAFTAEPPCTGVAATILFWHFYCFYAAAEFLINITLYKLFWAPLHELFSPSSAGSL